MCLKSVTATPLPRSAYAALSPDWSQSLPDGTPLAESYAWEEARLNAMRIGEADPLAYVWVPRTSISLSRREAARLDLSRYDTEPLGIRGTGGTAVPQGPGTANITLFTRHRQQPGIPEFYNALCAALMEGFSLLGLETTIGAKPGSFCDGDYNLLLDGRKLVGTAQRWCRARNGETLGAHHVVVLLGADPATLCARVERLYAAAAAPESYDPSAHSDVPIDLDALRSAMAAPLAEFVSQTG